MKAKKLFFKLLTINYVVFVAAAVLFYPCNALLNILVAAVEAAYIFYETLKDALWRIDLSKNNFDKIHKYRWRK